MNVNYTTEDLLGFEEEIAKLFASGAITAPIHLGGGNERELIWIFKSYVKEDDWVLCSWRSHYHCLLKGVPRDELRRAIIAGSSVGLCFPQYKILCSGIVGGTAPISVGLAHAIKAAGKKQKVHCFVGDMSAESGIYHESTKYSTRHQLPVQWVVEDNGLSVCTDTQAVWGPNVREAIQRVCYKYKLTRPHVGIGKWVAF